MSARQLSAEDVQAVVELATELTEGILADVKAASLAAWEAEWVGDTPPETWTEAYGAGVVFSVGATMTALQKRGLLNFTKDET